MKKSIIYSLLFIASIFVVSCGDEDPTCDDGIQNGEETGIDCGGPDCAPCVTTVEDDKANIQETFDDLLMCVTDLKNSRTIDVLFRDFLQLSNGEVKNESWIEDFTGSLEGVFDGEHVEENSRLDLAYHAGTHMYDHNLGYWTKVNNVDDRMIFLFPSEPNMTTNNVELIMDKYEDQQVVIDGESLFLPTAIHVIMNIDNERIMELDVTKIVYAENQNYEIPVEISATLFMDPVNMTIDLTRLSTTAYNFTTTIEDGSTCLIGVEVDIELKDDDFENLTSDGFEKVHAKVNVGKMTIQSLADIATLISLAEDDNLTDTQVNSLLDIDALFDGIKIADIEISEEQEAVIIFYKDLTSENSNVYYESFWEDVKGLWDEFFD